MEKEIEGYKADTGDFKIAHGVLGYYITYKNISIGCCWRYKEDAEWELKQLLEGKGRTDIRISFDTVCRALKEKGGKDD